MNTLNPQFTLDLITQTLGKVNLKKSISTHEPDFLESNAWLYLKDCLDSNWVSSSGKWLEKFEKLISLFTGSPEVIAVSNGTDALRLAFYLVGVKRDEEVIVPSLSFVGTCNAISHLGAYPHFVDIEKNTLGIDPMKLEKYLENIAVKKNDKLINKITGRRIAAICPVHVFGNPSNCFVLKEIADRLSIPLVEDAAEALGSFISNTHCGLIGDIGILSFNGNKIITTGGGGALLIKNKKLAKRARHLSTTAKINHPWEIFHDEIAWNDRLPNLNAALGVAQMENISEKIKLKKKLFDNYCDCFKELSFVKIFQNNLSNSSSNNWLISLIIELPDLIETKKFRDELLKISHDQGIFLRPVWQPIHTLPMYQNVPKASLDVTNEMSMRIINLPSSPQLAKASFCKN